jgi:peptidoglycan/LPS O-acetylase OafA/YrhL
VSAYLPQLDGLRGIAILAVLAYHLGSKLPSLHLETLTRYGWAGVDLFFVISGFLITGILLDSARSEHYFRNFYVRRVLRIWPLYFALLIFVFLLLPVLIPSLRERIFTQCHPWQSYLFFVQNFFVRDFGIGPVGVTWSLAIEEQFYLAWPLLVFLLPRKTLPFFLLAVIVLSPIARAFALLHGASPILLYTHTLYRLDAISAGALLAVWARSSRFFRPSTLRFFLATAFVGLGASALTLRIFPATSASSNLRFSALAVLCFGLVGSALLVDQASGMSKVLNLAWLRYAGKICFGLYLLHVIVFDVLAPERLRFLGTGWAGSLGVLAIDFAAAMVLATLSWKFFENPILKMKHRFEYGRAGAPPAAPEPPEPLTIAQSATHA